MNITVSSDVSIKAVQQMLGHSSAAMTGRVPEPFDEDLNAVADVLDSAPMTIRPSISNEVERDRLIEPLRRSGGLWPCSRLLAEFAPYVGTGDGVAMVCTNVNGPLSEQVFPLQPVQVLHDQFTQEVGLGASCACGKSVYPRFSFRRQTN